MGQDLQHIEDLVLTANYPEALRLLDAALAKDSKNVGFLKQKASLIELAPQSKYTLKDAEKCLLRAHQLAPRNLDVINDLVRFYDKALPNPQQKESFYKLFISIVDRMMGITD